MVIGCCSWPIWARLRVTGPSGSAVGVWSSVWQFCVLSAIRLVSGGKRHHTSAVLHVGGNRWASSLLFKLLGRFSIFESCVFCFKWHGILHSTGNASQRY